MNNNYIKFNTFILHLRQKCIYTWYNIVYYVNEIQNTIAQIKRVGKVSSDTIWQGFIMFKLRLKRSLGQFLFNLLGGLLEVPILNDCQKVTWEKKFVCLCPSYYFYCISELNFCC